MMFIRSLADFNGTPWAVQVTVGAITVTAQATSSPDRHDKQGSGDFYLAISGDLQLATSGDFYMATDIRVRRIVLARCARQERRRCHDLGSAAAILWRHKSVLCRDRGPPTDRITTIHDSERHSQRSRRPT
jgi:hypothetical protein